MPKKMTFEAAMSRLDEIVAAMEAGDLPLEQSMKLFEEGVRLTDFCSDTLKKAELKITELSGDKETALTSEESR
ncbi:MAG: exodeoxyribonuclease VII small subunit [Clostridiales bacterium]|nr:exodeoxyribonuclease VII small subunit [Clostridiales bacterium]